MLALLVGTKVKLRTLSNSISKGIRGRGYETLARRSQGTDD